MKNRLRSLGGQEHKKKRAGKRRQTGGENKSGVRTPKWTELSLKEHLETASRPGCERGVGAELRRTGGVTGPRGRSQLLGVGPRKRGVAMPRDPVLSGAGSSLEVDETGREGPALEFETRGLRRSPRAGPGLAWRPGWGRRSAQRVGRGESRGAEGPLTASVRRSLWSRCP